MTSKTNLTIVGAVLAVGLVAGIVGLQSGEAPAAREIEPQAERDRVELEAGGQELVGGSRASALFQGSSMDSESDSGPLSMLSSWRDCLAEQDELGALYECLRESGAAEAVDLRDLSRYLCDEEWGQRQANALVSVVCSASTPTGFLRALMENGETCGRLDEALTAFFANQRNEDPDWCTELALKLEPEHLFSPGGMSLLELAAAEAEVGSDRLRSLLEAGGRGEFGGSDTLVARSLVLAWDVQYDVEARLELMESVLTSGTFQGRDFETDALLGLALNAGSFPQGDPTRALDLAERMLHDPRLGPGAAEHLLILQDWCDVPDSVGSERRAKLVDIARGMHPADD